MHTGVIEGIYLRQCSGNLHKRGRELGRWRAPRGGGARAVQGEDQHALSKAGNIATSLKPVILSKPILFILKQGVHAVCISSQHASSQEEVGHGRVMSGKRDNHLRRKANEKGKLN
eukprot:6214573-Pleurochrysis_carterae.AAC.2